MPNWCSTSLVVRGPEDEIKSFYEGCVTVNDEGETQYNILQGHLPCPKELSETTSTSALKEIPENWKKMVTDGEWTQEQYDQRVAENNELLKKQEANKAKFGASDWYDWQVNNWGVKWGDCETDFHTKPQPTGHKDLWFTTASFQTPWGTASPAFRELSKKYPNCIFMADSDEEAGFFQGIEMHYEGALVFEDYFEPCNYPEEVDWDDDVSIDKYNEWKDENMDKIADSAFEYLQNRGWIPMPIIPPKPKIAVKKGKPHVWK
jgi:hypothetical protein